MKKAICLLLIVLLTAVFTTSVSAGSLFPSPEEPSAASVTVDEAIAQYEAEHGEKVETRRYYFQMPDGVHGIRYEGMVATSWYNDYSQGAGVFWWGDVPAACKSWPGYRAAVADAAQHIYYVDMPAQVDAFVWNNGVDGGTDPDQEIFSKAAQSIDIPSENAYPEEYETMPEGCDSFDGCIFVIIPEELSISNMSVRQQSNGTWYFYYGSGCYGMYAEDSESFKSIEENCCNPDHFDADGNHIGYVPETLRADYDRDGVITILDATRAQNILADLYNEDDKAFLAAIDADGDKELTIIDATRIQNVVAELTDMDGSKK